MTIAELREILSQFPDTTPVDLVRPGTAVIVPLTSAHVYYNVSADALEIVADPDDD